MSYSDEQLLNFLDGQMSESEVRQLIDEANGDASLQSRLDMIEASRLPYEDAYRAKPPPPVPTQLRQDVSALSAAALAEPVQIGRTRRKYAGVAGVALSIGAMMGYALAPLAIQSASNEEADDASATTLMASTEDEAWVNRVADYQSLYVSETVADAPEGLEKAQKLMLKLQENSELETAIPDLSEFGYQFARAQHLGFEGDVLVQLVYTRAGRKPLALCYMAIQSSDTTNSHIGSREALGTANWRQGGQRYVIVADESAQTLSSMADLARQSWI